MMLSINNCPARLRPVTVSLSLFFFSSSSPFLSLFSHLFLLSYSYSSYSCSPRLASILNIYHSHHASQILRRRKLQDVRNSPTILGYSAVH